MLTVDVLERFPEAQEKWQNAFRYLLVDEYQDTNHAQYRFLQAARGEALERVRGRRPGSVPASTARWSRWPTGAKKPIEDVRVGDDGPDVLRERRLRTRSRARRPTDRRGRAGIAITTGSGRRIVSTPEHMHFAGFKVGRTPQLHMTYLMWKRGVGFRIGTSRTYLNRHEQTMPGPALRMNGEHADATWVLGMHESRCRGSRDRDAPLAPLRNTDAPVRRAALPELAGPESRRGSAVARSCLQRARQ